MRTFVNSAIGVLSIVLLAATPPVWAAGRSKGGGGGAGGDVAGGLPALEDRVDCLNAAHAGASTWAVVEAGGTVARSQPATGITVEHVAGSGVYEVTFTQNVSSCAYEATVGDTAAAVPTQASISVSGDTDGDNPDDVYVQTFVGTTATDSPFHLVVTCPVSSCP